jgi:antitoxin MazE
METRIGKWGNSLALRIPQSLAARLGLTLNSSVELTSEEGKLVASVVEPPLSELDELLAGITDSNLHGEIETGPAVGRELL